MKMKLNKKQFKMIRIFLISFAVINILFTISGGVAKASVGQNIAAGATGTLGVAGVAALAGTFPAVGLPLLFLNIIKLLIAVVGLVIQALISAFYMAMEPGLSPERLELKDIIFSGAENSDYSKFLSVNFFDFQDSGTMIYAIQTSIAKWYYILRLISIAILLVILIYIGIRMAISTIASEQAKYKHMLIDWVTSLALVFVLHYIIIIVIKINQVLVTALADLIGSNPSMLEQVAKEIWVDQLLGGILAAVIYAMYLGRLLSFLLLYIKRLITVGFLIMIAPLITITYAIDKLGDGKAQALNAWLKEFSYNVLIQTFHCILYLAFFDTIAKTITSDNSWNPIGISFNPGRYIMAIIIMNFMIKAEEILRKIFHFEASSMSSIGEAGQNVMNATGSFAKIGFKAGSLLAGTGAIRKLRRAGYNMKLSQAYRENGRSCQYANLDGYKNSKDGQ